MADKKHTLLVRGAQPYSYIWGYEEPENNLELSSAIKLADQLLRYLNDTVSQIFLTTHSPVFYNLHLNGSEQGVNVTSHHVFREEDVSGTKETTNPLDLDEHMGTMALFAPKIAELTDRIRQDQIALNDAKIQFEQQQSHLYVEGESDRIIIVKALELYQPNFANRITVITKLSGAGHSYVHDMLSAWRHMHKHNPERPKSAGLVDCDDAGKLVRKTWNDGDRNCESAKCFALEVPQHIRPMKTAGFKIPVVLETLYPPHIWAAESRSGNLIQYPVQKILNDTLIERVINERTTLSELHAEEWWSLYMGHITNERKIRLANEISNHRDAEEMLLEFRPTVTAIVRYLFPSEAE
jgi:hypothetical protein